MNNRRNIFIIVAVFLILILILGIKLFIDYKLYDLVAFNTEKIINFINSFHPYDDFVFIAIQIIQVLLAGVIPAEISGFVGGYLYGPIVGTIYSTIGLSIGSWLAFILSRRFGLPLVKKVVSPAILEKYDNFMTESGPLVSFTLFLIPGFPKAALCYIIGLSRMNVWIFIVISTFGRLFGTILLSLSGSSLRTMHIVTLSIILVTITIIYLFAYLYRKRLAKMPKK
ncbi:MAG: VTT domain-containing protein [Smithellaceae bacterium]